MARPTYDPDSLLVGLIGRPHGLGGEMTLHAHNSHGTDLFRVPLVVLERGGQREQRKVRSARRGADGSWLVRLEGIESRDAAAALTHVPVRVPKELLTPLGPGEFFVEDLLGCQVRNESGTLLGVVDSIFWNGAHDVMSVMRGRPADGDDVRGDHPRSVADEQSQADQGRRGDQGASPVSQSEQDTPSEQLIPLVPAFVRIVDAAARRIIVDWEAHD